jgi:hypothetical protein
MKRHSDSDESKAKKLKTIIDPQMAIVSRANQEYEFTLEQANRIDLHFHEQDKIIDDLYLAHKKRNADERDRLLKEVKSESDIFFGFLDNSDKNPNVSELHNLVEKSRTLTKDPTPLNLALMREINRFLAKAYHNRVSFIPFPLQNSVLGYYPVNNIEFYGKIQSLATDLPYKNKEGFAILPERLSDFQKPYACELIPLGRFIFRFLLWPTKLIIIQKFLDLRLAQFTASYKCG